MNEKKAILMSLDLANAIYAYLDSRPHGEVAGLIQGMKAEAAAQAPAVPAAETAPAEAPAEAEAA